MVHRNASEAPSCPGSPQVDQEPIDQTPFFDSVEELQQHGINNQDILKLKAADINTISGVNMTPRRQMLKIKGLSEAKVEKIKEAAHKILGSSGLEVSDKRKCVLNISTRSNSDGEFSGSEEEEAVSSEDAHATKRRRISRGKRKAVPSSSRRVASEDVSSGSEEEEAVSSEDAQSENPPQKRKRRIKRRAPKLRAQDIQDFQQVLDLGARGFLDELARHKIPVPQTAGFFFDELDDLFDSAKQHFDENLQEYQEKGLDRAFETVDWDSLGLQDSFSDLGSEDSS